MNSKEVVIDTNFFMVPFQFNVDIITELEKILPSYKTQVVGIRSFHNSNYIMIHKYERSRLMIR